MYVCVCHGISDREIRGRCAQEPCSVAGIYRARGVSPKCGKCVSTVRAMLAEAQSGTVTGTCGLTMIAGDREDAMVEVAFAQAS